MSDSIPPTYILCHSVKEKDKYEFLKKHLPQRGIPEDKQHFITGIWGDEISSDLYFKSYDPFYMHFGMVNPLTFKSVALSRGEVSLILNFMAGIEKAVHEKDDWILFLESDCILRKDFKERLQSILQNPKIADVDYVSIGEGIGITRPVPLGSSYYVPTELYPTMNPFLAFRCTDSMLLRRSFLEKLKKTLLPCKECLDWEMNIQLHVHGGKGLWADPPLVEQGSCRSRFVSSLPA
jgi:hypothetical protein